MKNPFSALRRWVHHVLDDGPDLTDEQIASMNAQGQADMEAGLDKMKRPVEDDPER